MKLPVQDYLFDNKIDIKSVKDLEIVKWTNKTELNNFLNRYHYLGQVQGWRYAFAIKYKDEIVGCAVFGRPIARLEDQRNTLELTRFVLIDECPQNSESYVLGRLIKLLRKEGWKRFIAYSDIEVGHKGTIYKATNWKQVGITGGRDWTHRPGRKCDVGIHKKIKWELCYE
ncbi:MAG: XF1762 family protein [candidate division WOR-3 bacterium]